MRHAFVGLGLLLLAGCGAAPVRPEPAQARFILEPDTARVYIDDRFVGMGRVLDRRPLRLAPGVRHFTVSAPGYFPHDIELDLPSGITTVRIGLRPIPP